MRLPRGGLRSLQLVEACAFGPRLAVPRHPDAHGLRTERLLPAHDGERVTRPLERVVGDSDEQMRRARRRRRTQDDDRRDDPCDGKEDEGDGQTPGDGRPRSDCISTRQPVAKTVRRYRRTERSAIHSRSCASFSAIDVS